MKSTKDFSSEINELKSLINNADAIIIGAGSGLSTSAGLTYSGKRFHELFHDFETKYNFHDMYSGGFYDYNTLEEYWAYWAHYIYCNRYCEIPGSVYSDLYNIVKGKNYFVITTNVDHCFQKSGFDKLRLFYTQGDYGLFQCSTPCHNKTYDNEEIVRKMVASETNMRIPTELIPMCPKCGKPMTMNLRIDDRFVEDNGWKSACERYAEFIERNKCKKVLYLELGVGMNTPAIMKYPFWRLTHANTNARYVCINNEMSYIPANIKDQSFCICADIGNVLKSIEEQ